jgi:hypothetical protein
MLKRLLLVLWYWRWPFAGSTTLLVLLALVMEPRPVATYRLPISHAAYSLEIVSVSPCGKYLVMRDDSFQRLHCYDLLSQERLWTITELKRAICVGRFDYRSGLAYSLEVGTQMQYWYWQPGWEKPRQVHAHRNNSVFSSTRYRGMQCLGSNQEGGTLLSPDGSIWLCMHTRNTKSQDIVAELRDSQSGALLATLDDTQLDRKPDVPAAPQEDRARMSSDQWLMAFTPDSQHLLALELDDDTQHQPLLQCFSVRDGKRLWECLLQTDKRKWKYLGCFLVDPERVIVIKSDGHQLYWHQQALGKDAEYSLTLIQETVPVPMQVSPWKNGSWTAHLESHDGVIQQNSNGRLFAAWNHVLYPTTGGMAGEPPYLPEYHLLLRDLTSGQTLHHEKIKHPRSAEFQYRAASIKFLTLLEGDRVLLNDYHRHVPEWRKQLEAWREKYAAWLPSFTVPYMKLIALDMATGKRDAMLSTSLQVMGATYVPEQHALYVATSDEDLFDEEHYCVIHQYRYPIRRPWLVIGGWTLGLLIVFMVLQSLLSFWRKRACSVRSKATASLDAR